MKDIWIPGGGGGGDGSDDCTLVRANVPKGLKAITADSDDEAVEGTLEAETTAADSHVLAGQTYVKYNPTTKLFERRSGGMANRGAVSQALNAGGSYTIPAGYHNGGGRVTANALSGQTPGTATAAQILAGRTAWVNGTKVTGSMANAAAVDPAKSVVLSGSAFYARMTNGAHIANASSGYPEVSIPQASVASAAGLTADKIKKGVSIMGITGTWEGYASSVWDIYNKGTWNGLQTTGFSATVLQEGALCGLEMRDNLIRLSTGTYQMTTVTSMARTNQIIDVTSYNYLKVTAGSRFNNATSASAKVGLSTTPQLASNSFVASVGIGQAGTHILNISSLSGRYYIYLYVSITRGASVLT